MNRRSISFSHTEGRVWARASKRHNVLFMQPGKTVREGCPWSGKWRAAMEHTKLTALPAQTQFPLNWWPIFPFQRREREGERGEKEKSPISLPLNPCWGNHTGPILFPMRAACTAGEQERECLWWIQELLLLTSLLICCTCSVVCIMPGGKQNFPKWKYIWSKKDQNSIMVKWRTAIRYTFSGFCRLKCRSWSPKLFS